MWLAGLQQAELQERCSSPVLQITEYKIKFGISVFCELDLIECQKILEHTSFFEVFAEEQLTLLLVYDQ